MKTAFQLHIDPDRVVRCDVFKSATKARGTVIMAHGYKGFKDWGMFPYAAQQLSDGLDVITFNFSMNGIGEDGKTYTDLEKFARNTYSRELEDLGALVESVKEGKLEDVGIDGSLPLFLIGHSRGGGVSLIYAFDHPQHVSGVIGWNSLSNVDLFSAEQKQEMKEKGRSYVLNGRTKQQMPLDVEILEDMEVNAERFNILARVAAAQVPIALVQGTVDFERLRKGSQRMVASNPKIQWKLIEGGNHTFGAVHPFQGETEPLQEAIQVTKRIIEEWLGE